MLQKDSKYLVVNDTINNNFEMNKIKPGTAQQCRHGAKIMDFIPTHVFWHI